MALGLLPGNLVLAWILFSLTSANNPPRQVGSYQSRQVAKVGQNKKKFLCPVAGDPVPIVQWSKDGETINDIKWTRFHVNKEGSLRIKDIELEDAGKYVCKATNGFGSIYVNFSLVVVDKESGQVKEGLHIFTDKHDEDFTKDGVPPHFVEEQKMQRDRTIRRPANRTVQMKCRGVGNPRPHIRWTKDGVTILESSDDSESSQKRKWTLKLHDLKKSDSGDYQCVLYNRYGSVNFTYTLEVIGKVKKPVLVGPHPMNTTVRIRDTAQFICKVKSKVKPRIQWLKRIDKHLPMHGDNSTTIKVWGQTFVVLKTGEAWQDADGLFLNKLIIKNVLPIDVGMYICMGANAMGYRIRSAFLTISHGMQDTELGLGMGDVEKYSFDDRQPVLDGRKSSSSTTSNNNSADDVGDGSLPLIIAIPSCVIVVLVTLAIFILKRRRRCNTPSSSANTTHRNTRFNAVPTQEREHYVGVPGVQTNTHNIPQAVIPNSRLSDKVAKNPSLDFYSDISSVSRCHHQQLPPQQQQQQQQQHNVQYGGY